jgi:phage tail protein X
VTIRSAALALLLLALPAPLAAQTYSLAPPPYQTVFNNSGDKVSNACVWTYAAGTSTPIATYSDNLGTANTNPIRTDTAGRLTVYLTPGTGYKFVYELPCTPPGHGTVLRTADNVAGTPAASVVTTGTWIPTLGGTTTYTTREGSWVRVGALVFARGQLTVSTIGTGSTFEIDGLPFAVNGRTSAVVGSVITGAVSFAHVGAVASGTTTIDFIGLTAAGASMGFLNIFGNGTFVDFTVTYNTLAP